MYRYKIPKLAQLQFQKKKIVPSAALHGGLLHPLVVISGLVAKIRGDIVVAKRI